MFRYSIGYKVWSEPSRLFLIGFSWKLTNKPHFTSTYLWKVVMMRLQCFSSCLVLPFEKQLTRYFCSGFSLAFCPIWVLFCESKICTADLPVYVCIHGESFDLKGKHFTDVRVMFRGIDKHGITVKHWLNNIK